MGMNVRFDSGERPPYGGRHRRTSAQARNLRRLPRGGPVLLVARAVVHGATLDVARRLSRLGRR
jgi:hypothetical protein